MNYTIENNITDDDVEEFKHLFTGDTHERMIFIVQARLRRVSIVAIAKHFNRSVERIRQMEMKAVQMLKEYIERTK